MIERWKWSFALLAAGTLACGGDGGGGGEDTPDTEADTSEDFDGFTGTDSGADSGQEDVAEDTATGEDVLNDSGTDTTEADAIEDSGNDTNQPDATEDSGTDTTEDIGADTALDADTSDAMDAADDATDIVEPLTVDWCRLQFPDAWTAAPESSLTVYGRVFAAGLTDLTRGNDLDPLLVGEVGVGPDDSMPDESWSWFEATGNPGWIDDEEPGNDEYQADLTLPDTEGEYDFAYRFSLDAGVTWLYCDADAGDGSDGAADGYQTENAGQLSVVSVEDLCDPNPCTDEGMPVCLDDTVVQNVTPGTCSVSEGTAVCDYTTEVVDDCEAAGTVCVGGFCRADGLPPAEAGDVLIVEIMLDTGADELASWFEITNRTDADLDLAGCVFTHEDDEWMVDTPLVARSFGHEVVGSTDDDALIGFGPDAVWSGLTPADVEGTITLSCSGTEIDSVSYVSADFTEGVSRQVGIDDYDVDSNDEWSNWCEGEEAPDTPGATPGSENPPCPRPAPELTNCWIQFPDTISANRSESFSIYSQVEAPGITDATDRTDDGSEIDAEFGTGADGSDPASDDSWIWAGASANTGFSSTDGIDEYQFDTTFAELEPGEYDYAYRYSIDGGESWMYCDLIVDSSVGAADGYQPENSGALTVLAPSPCEPNPCTEPPASICDGDEAVTYPDTGTCTVTGDAASCDYTEAREDCAAAGGTCAEGSCASLPAASVDFCKIQFPTSVELSVDSSQTYYGRIYSAGITDRSTSTDPYGPLVIEWGFGAEADEVSTWTWLATEPNPGYVGSGFTEGEDEYQVSVTHESAGTYRFAFRASGDGGETWTYCDINGANEDGSVAFDISDTGTLLVLE